MTATPVAPDTPSSDYAAMLPYWNKVETILNGAEAMRAAGETYLPKFPNESQADYDYRRVNAKFTNLYSDIVNNLSAKPFAEKVTIEEGASPRFKAMADDIDGRGNNLHVFAADTFFCGINNAIDWILVDYTHVRPGATLADERRIGARPYWVHIPAKRMIAAYSATVNGQEIWVHARIREDFVERSGFGEVSVERVRIFNREALSDLETGAVVGYAPATFLVMEKRAEKNGGSSWVEIEQGDISLGIIPLVPFITGRRKDGGLRFVPPMQDVADAQVEHYQQETKLKCASDRTAFPLLAAEGVEPDRDADGSPKPISIGPGAVVWAPPFGDTGNHGEWNFKEPSATSLNFLAGQIATTEQQMRELGRQPLTATSGITVVSAAYAGQKASSAVQAWAWGLKDALEQAMAITALWLKEPKAPTVKVFTDFALEIGEDKGPDALATMRSSGDLSQETLWSEMKRRNILSSDFDAAAERKRLEDETPDPDAEADMVAALGNNPPADPDPLDEAA